MVKWLSHRVVYRFFRCCVFSTNAGCWDKSRHEGLDHPHSFFLYYFLRDLQYSPMTFNFKRLQRRLCVRIQNPRFTVEGQYDYSWIF